MGPVSALEMACWDIVGKAAGVPVYELLGGRVHESLRSYTYLYPLGDDVGDVYLDPDAAASPCRRGGRARLHARSNSTQPAHTR